MSIHNDKSMCYTEKQGQYLAFIFYYTKVNGAAPAQIDLQRYFKVTPPSVHQMLLSLEKKELIQRIPNKARAIKINIDPGQLPKLI